MADKLVLGQKAPAFSGIDSNGKKVSLADFKGKWVILYFYPKAFTPGCTAQGCSLRDHHAEIEAQNAVVIGVSLDSPAQLKEFKEKYRFPFMLLSDQDKSIAEAYDTLGLLGAYTKRHSFLIDPEGQLAKIMRKVDTKNHGEEVYHLLESISA